MNLQGCYEKRLLRKTGPDKEKSKKALEMAERALKQAKDLSDHGFHEQAVLYSYTAMFQAARSLLFRDGITEKSHYCTVQYLKENYVKQGKLEQRHLQWLDTYRIERHTTLYGLNEISIEEEDAKTAITSAEEFIETIADLLKGED